jgi:hypothetical protein
MGFRKSWDVADISTQLHALARECASPYNDGFTAFYAKQDLYQVKAMVDAALKDSPDFGDLEKDWLQEQEKKRIIKILKS